MSDLRYALRRLRRSPLFTSFAILALGLGLGVSTTAFAVVRQVLGPPPGVRDPATVVSIAHWPGGTPFTSPMSSADYQDLLARQTTLAGVAAWSRFVPVFAGNARSGAGLGEFVSGTYFDVLGARLTRGRGLQPSDDRPDAPSVVVISHRTWTQLFDAADNAIGQRLKVNGEAFTVVGVAAPEFIGLGGYGVSTMSLWLPLASAPLVRDRNSPVEPDARWLNVAARVENAEIVLRVATEMTALGSDLDRVRPMGGTSPFRRQSLRTSRQWTVTRLSDGNNVREARVAAGSLLTAVMVVLLVACSNLASLILVRSTARQHEVALRLALGASRSRIIREALVESIVLVGAGCAAGLVVARGLTNALTMDLSMPGTSATLHLAPRVDAAAVVACVIASLFALVVAGAAPASSAARASLRAIVAGEGSSAALPRSRGRRFLIALQVTASIVLIAIASLSVGELRRLSGLQPGFDIQHLGVAAVNFDEQRFDATRVKRVLDDVTAELRRNPDVRAISISSGLPNRAGWGVVRVVGDATDRPTPVIRATSSFFDTLRIPILRGRGFDSIEVDPARASSVISESAARTLFGGTDAVSRQFRLKQEQIEGETAREMTVVGVVADIGEERNQRAREVIYVPIEPEMKGRVVLIARTAGDPHTMLPLIRRAFAKAEPELALGPVDVGIDVGGSTTQFFQITAGIGSVLGAFAWMLALVGLYGALSHVVILRTREIGVRLALGATRRDIGRMVVRHGLAPVMWGSVAGLFLGAIVRLSLPLLQRIVPTVDLFEIAVVPLMFIMGGALACYLPARRAASVDPLTALKDL